ncbi:MAG TPA: FAD-binding oxidoreductase [Acidimicrobiales bacterium]|jgi:FAD/FMN-containing dehydrogenase|nr:FAD-binding oxidoreductase [Acidimicrobiales bacterium]
MGTAPLDRRSFLAAAASGAAAVGLATGLEGCEDRGAPPGTAVPVVAGRGATAAQWAQLAASLTGRLVRPGMPAYATAKLLYDPRFDALAPVAIAYCRTTSDVARSIAFARAHGYRLAVRAGGHSYAGYSSGTGRLVVDVTSMAGVVPASAPGRAARVGAGARLVDVYNTLGRHGQLVPGGSCPTVGIAGLTLGGGVGVFARRYGLAADNLAALTVVSADGTVRRCAPTENPDLYWACRGGGGGNFGVATSFEFTTHPLPTVTLFTYDFDWAAAHDVLGAWQRWTATVHPAVWSNCQLLSGGGTSVRVAGVACATTAQAAAWLAPLLHEVRPVSSFLGGEAYQRAMMIEGGCEGLTVAACHLDTAHPPGVLGRQAFVASSSYVASPMGDARLRAVVSVVDALAAELPTFGGGLVFDALGGKVNDVAATDTAFVHRHFLASIQSSFSWGSSATPAQLRAGARWLARVRAAVYDPSTGAYQNYIDPTLPNWPHAYYGQNLARLQAIKAVVDPDEVFSFAQSIP